MDDHEIDAGADSAAEKDSSSSGWGETVRTVLYALGIALLVRTFAYEPFSIPSGSMKPTLLIGDYLFVSKLSYGLSRYSVPFSPPLFSGRVFEDAPERGDVAVFRQPTDTSIDYIKRIVGLPGDRLQVVRGLLHINGQPVKRERIEDYLKRDSFGNVTRVYQYVETLPNGVSHRILEEQGDRGAMDNTPVFTVPQGHYFGMGDNRDNSRDSRFPDVGYIPAENFIGRADVLFFSKREDVAWWQIWALPFGLRYDRFFGAIE